MTESSYSYELIDWSIPVDHQNGWIEYDYTHLVSHPAINEIEPFAKMESILLVKSTNPHNHFESQKCNFTVNFYLIRNSSGNKLKKPLLSWSQVERFVEIPFIYDDSNYDKFVERIANLYLTGRALIRKKLSTPQFSNIINDHPQLQV